MPHNTIVRSSLQLAATIQVTGFIPPRIVQQNIAGLWQCEIDIPAISGGRVKAADAYLRIRVSSVSKPNTDYRHLGVVTISLSLKTLEGETVVSRSNERNMSDDSEDRWVDLLPVSAPSADNARIRRDDGFYVEVTLSNVPPPTRPIIADQLLLDNVLHLMEGQDIIDTKFLVFSTRRVVNNVAGAYDPLPVYANSKLMKNQCPYFDRLLGDSNFQSECFGQPPARFHIDGYEDDNDSDMGYFSEDEAETEEADDDNDWLEPDPTSAISTTHSLRSASRQRSTQTNLSDGSPSIGQDLDGTLHGNPEEKRWPSLRLQRKHQRQHNKFGKVVEIQDFAYVTWKALIFYLCTSYISFAPLSASERARIRSGAERSQGLPSKPSAKSIYRAAVKLGLEDLATKALDHIRSELTVEIVLTELFSKFTSRFEKVREIELKFVFEHWEHLNTSDALKGKIKSVVDGEIPYADEVLVPLMARLSSSSKS